MSKYETKGGQVTQGETYTRLMHHLEEMQNQCCVMAHLTRSMSSSKQDNALADGWIAMSELFKRVQYQVTTLAQGRLQ